ncbi:MAG: redoxin domain-containing protein [Bacteroidales bacterium]
MVSKTKLLIICTTILSIVSTSIAQHTISGQIEGGAGNKVKLAYFKGDHLQVFDSALCDASGRFTIQVPPYLPQAQMRLLTRNRGSLEFLYPRQSVEIRSHLNYLEDSAKFVNSEVNIDLRNFWKYEAQHLKALELLQTLLDEYPDHLPFYQEVAREYIMRQIDFEATLNQLIVKNQNNLASHILMTRRRPRIDPSLTGKRRTEYLREHYFDNIPADDTSLIYTPAYTRLVIEYLMLYTNPGSDKKELEMSIIEGLKVVMDKFQPSPAIYDLITEYLLDGFQTYGFENVVQWLSERYATERCESGNPELARRAATLRNLAPGKPAPDISGIDMQGKKMSLADYRGKYVLLAFWGSWCPHCAEIMPRIDQLLTDPQKKAGWEMVGISIDTDVKAVRNAMKEKQFHFRNLADGKGWDSPAAQAYGVAATPTFIFIDPEGNIVAKPGTLFEIIDLLKTNGLLDSDQ